MRRNVAKRRETRRLKTSLKYEVFTTTIEGKDVRELIRIPINVLKIKNRQRKEIEISKIAGYMGWGGIVCRDIEKLERLRLEGRL